MENGLEVYLNDGSPKNKWPPGQGVQWQGFESSQPTFNELLKKVRTVPSTSHEAI